MTEALITVMTSHRRPWPLDSGLWHRRYMRKRHNIKYRQQEEKKQKIDTIRYDTVYLHAFKSWRDGQLSQKRKNKEKLKTKKRVAQKKRSGQPSPWRQSRRCLIYKLQTLLLHLSESLSFNHWRIQGGPLATWASAQNALKVAIIRLKIKKKFAPSPDPS